MPNVLIWNIEQFGARFANDANSQALRRALIVGIIQDAQADILIIQEVRANAGPELVALRQALNQGNNDNWGFDWVAGALVNNTTAPQFTDVGFEKQANSEGYAVLFKQPQQALLAPIPAQSQAASFRLDSIANPPTVLNVALRYIGLITEGFTPVFQYNQYICINFNWGNPVQQGVVLGFPVPVGTPNVVNGNNLDVLIRTKVRRPCFILVNSGNQRVSVVCYHAPAAPPGALYGTLAAFGSDALGPAEHRVLGGDFNLNTEDPIATVYGQQVAQMYTDSCITPLVNNGWTTPTTTVHSTVVQGGVYVWANANVSYRTSARDFAMSAIPNQQQAYAVAVMNPVETMLNNNSVVAAALNVFVGNAGQLLALRNTMALDPYFTNAVVAGGTRENVILHYLNVPNRPPMPGNADNTTAVAIITEYFLSDHMPIGVQI